MSKIFSRCSLRHKACKDDSISHCFHFNAVKSAESSSQLFYLLFSKTDVLIGVLQLLFEGVKAVLPLL